MFPGGHLQKITKGKYIVESWFIVYHSWEVAYKKHKIIVLFSWKGVLMILLVALFKQDNRKSF
jgi:hypothetical protein